MADGALLFGVDVFEAGFAGGMLVQADHHGHLPDKIECFQANGALILAAEETVDGDLLFVFVDETFLAFLGCHRFIRVA